MKKIVVVGAGFSGSILARKIAEECGMHVQIVEKRSHIAGNAYDEYDKNGILIQKYGPHFLNTNKYFIIEFLEQYAELFQHDTDLMSYIDGNYVRLPFNFRTLQQLVGAKESEHLLKKMREAFAGRDRVPIFELIEHADEDIRAYGELLFEKAYRTYTAKQWGLQPEEIDKSVLERVPMAMNFDARYLNKDFQYLPKYGFTKMFEQILDHPNISVDLNTDALQHISFDQEHGVIQYDGEIIDLLIYTGAIDELFGLKYGRLPYRSLDIRYNYQEKKSILPCEIISYPQADGYTRSTEYKKFTYGLDQDIPVSMIATEYPLAYDPEAEVGNIPYYPIITTENLENYGKYLKETEKYGNIILCGRLAEYKYYNMDICIEHALEKFEEVKKYLERKDEV